MLISCVSPDSACIPSTGRFKKIKRNQDAQTAKLSVRRMGTAQVTTALLQKTEIDDGECDAPQQRIPPARRSWRTTY
jgi:hypothetical protein